jgi:lysine 6-dehydrogenase
MKFLVLGAGRMGYAVAYDLIRSNKQNVKKIVVADENRANLESLMKNLADERIVPVQLDVRKSQDVAAIMSEMDVAIACIAYEHNYELAKIALSTHTHFVDLGGNEEVVARQFTLDEVARDEQVAIIPDLGLAPGLVSLLAVSAASTLDEVYEMKLRVGGLPVEADDLLLNYAQVFSIDGLINEYVEDCTIIRNGKLARVPSLTELEEIEFPRPFGKMEAFTTSGGISTMPQSYLGKVHNLDYKTIRYKGHCAAVKALKDIGLMDSNPITLEPEGIKVPPRRILHELLSQRLLKGEPDVVLVQVVVTGVKDKKPLQYVWQCIDYNEQAAGLSAMMRMTAFPASIIAQMLARNDIKERGVLRQESVVPIKLFLAEMDSRGINLQMIEREPA